jgi:hypothetical protein
MKPSIGNILVHAKHLNDDYKRMLMMECSELDNNLVFYLGNHQLKDVSISSYDKYSKLYYMVSKESVRVVNDLQSMIKMMHFLKSDVKSVTSPVMYENSLQYLNSCYHQSTLPIEWCLNKNIYYDGRRSKEDDGKIVGEISSFLKDEPWIF